MIFSPLLGKNWKVLIHFKNTYNIKWYRILINFFIYLNLDNISLVSIKNSFILNKKTEMRISLEKIRYLWMFDVIFIDFWSSQNIKEIFYGII